MTVKPVKPGTGHHTGSSKNPVFKTLVITILTNCIPLTSLQTYFKCIPQTSLPSLQNYLTNEKQLKTANYPGQLSRLF